MEQKFKEVIINQKEPVQYTKNLNLKSPSDHFPTNYAYCDSQYYRSEIFFKKINNGFWVIVQETEEEIDTCYTIPPKKDKSGSFSIHYYQSKSLFGCKYNGETFYTKDIIVFSGTESSHQIYVKRKTSIRCSKLIFAKNYLQKIANAGKEELQTTKANKIVSSGGGIFVRPVYEIEKIIIDKLHFLLKYGPMRTNYNLSVAASAFNVADQFFNLSEHGKHPPRMLNDQQLMEGIQRRLEENIKDKFPGIESLASEFYISPTKLKQEFRKIFNTTPLHYFRNMQINYAIEIMKMKKITIKEISFELGLKNTRHFQTGSKNTLARILMNYDPSLQNKRICKVNKSHTP